jgi:leucyl-tRNA synthetase
LGDVTARYQRLLGKSVLYGTDWDAFGLPNELGAVEAGVSPAEFSAANIARMRRSLERLGVSYDWSRVHATCDPAYYRWTQWLFLELFRHGLAYRQEAEINWCRSCQTSLAAMQAADGACWRCGGPVERRRLPQWFVATWRFADRLREGVDALDAWGRTGKKLVLRDLAPSTSGDSPEQQPVDWQVSRQRAWGAPIPIIYCTNCGVVPDRDLPVPLPENLNWSLGPRALEQCDAFRHTRCPSCGAAATRETDTLDCFFDDSWSFLSCVPALDECTEFPAVELAPWMPVDCFHSGFDTFAYLNLYRFMGRFVAEGNLVSSPEPILGYHGHDMVLAGGRKMSKHLGNAVDAEGLLEAHGADALRITVLWAARPERALDWNHANFQRAKLFLDRVWALYGAATGPAATSASPAASSSAGGALMKFLQRSWRRVAAFIEDYRPNAAIEELHECAARLESFAKSPPSASHAATDAAVVKQALTEFAIALSPFAPHLAEEMARRVGLSALAATASWPGGREE